MWRMMVRRCTPRLVGDRLVAGKALVGFAVAEGEKGRYRLSRPSRAEWPCTDWRSLRSGSSDFLLCGLWIWGRYRSCGMRSWNFHLSIHPCQYATLLRVEPLPVGTLAGCRVPWSFLVGKPFRASGQYHFLPNYLVKYLQSGLRRIASYPKAFCQQNPHFCCRLE